MRSITEKLTLDKDKQIITSDTPDDTLTLSDNEYIPSDSVLAENYQKLANIPADEIPSKVHPRSLLSPKTVKGLVDRSTQNEYNELYICQKCNKAKQSPNKEKLSPNRSKKVKEIPVQANVQLTTLNYMMKELHTLLGDKRDLEVDRLLGEIDHIVGSLPFSMNNLTPDMQTEINFTLQPLRVNNAELRRKLRLANQKIKELSLQVDRFSKEEEFVSQQKKNASDALHKKLLIEEKTKTQLSSQIADVCKATDELRIENQKLLQTLSEKEAKQFQERSSWFSEKSKLTQEISHLQSVKEQNEVVVQAKAKELNIAELSVKQRDAEIQRLRKLNSDLQESVSTLLADIKLERQNTRQIKRPKPPEVSKAKTDMRTIQKPQSETASTTSKPNIYNGIQSIITKHYQTEHPASISTSSTFVSSTFDSLYSGVEGTLSTLGTYDNLDFQRDLDNLDEEINKIQRNLKDTPTNVLTLH